MAITTPSRDVLKRVFKDHQVVIAIEQLFKTVQTDLTPINELIAQILLALEDVQIESGEGIARAQQALDALFQDKNHGAFFDTTDQAAIAVDVPKAATFNGTQISNGVSVSGSQITVAKTGTYKVEVRIQL
ncbi:hypothetical protein KAR91_21320 [Candidatus Pacearchaeota archaeon]|nr:hypothetical protein [Candidatus Pacearchaeota archaeon]